MQTNRVRKSSVRILAAASTVSLAIVSGALAGTTGSDVTVSIAGSTALKNWLVANTSTFTDVQGYEPNATDPGVGPALDTGYLSIGGNTYPNTTTYPLSADGGSTYWANNGGVGLSYQLAPKTYMGGTTNSSTPSAVVSDAVRFEYHESGSVEGILELANDQLYTNTNLANSIQYVTENVDRNPDSGNAVWVNYNQIGTSGVKTTNAWNAAGVTVGGYTLGNFYSSGVGQVGTAGETTPWSFGSATNPLATFNTAGVNASGGQNAVQAAMSDAVPQQVFANNYGSYNNSYVAANGTAEVDTGATNSSFNASELDLGYGQGNPDLPTGTVGTSGFRAQYQQPNVLQVNASSINPRTGAAFGAGPWTSASDNGLGNLNSQLTAVTATVFVANPGTGLTQLDRTDSDWLQTASRFANGAGFNMTTRDVNSGTRDVAGLDTGVDPSYATGKNDNGNGNLSTGATSQDSIGSSLRFSNKTAGGAELRPTVQSNRMAVGTLSINDANGSVFNTKANPIRALSYSDSVNGNSPYVQASYATISDGQYVIYQNEQVVTLKNMSSAAAYNASGVTIDPNTGAEVLTGTIQGDDADNDVETLINNSTNSVATASGAATPLNPADGLLSQGYLIPSLMQVKKTYNGEGLNNSVAGQIATGNIVSQSNLTSAGGNFNQSLYNLYTTSGYESAMTVGDPTTVFAGASSFYGGNTNVATPTGFNGNIAMTSQTGFDGIANHGGNWLFGNFNQDGVRDFSALQTGLAADRILIGDDQAAGATVPGSSLTLASDGLTGGTLGDSNSTVIIPNATYASNPTLAPLADMNGGTGATKGDLIAMGDFLGSGHFDGASLKAFAENAALADNAGGTQLITKTYQTGVSVKNAAMDWLNTNVGTTGADAYIRQSAAAILEGTSIPAGATPVYIGTSTVQATDAVATADQPNQATVYEYTYDPTGANAFNKSDVNGDGTIDFNDAVIVDNENGQDYSNLADQVNATMPTPVTGVAEPLNLVMAKQSDGSTVINSSDVSVVNTQLTGVGTTNWYGYNLQKTGPSTITFERTGGQVNVYSGASFEISSGTVQIGSSSVSGTIDPFSGTGPTAGNHVSVTLDHGGQLVLASDPVTYTVGGLSIDTASNSAMNLGDNTVIVNNASISSIQGYLIAGYNGGSWNGPGIFSSAVASQNALGGLQYGIGWASGSDGTHAVASLSSGQVELKYTLLGDANLDGTVNGSDFSILAANFGLGVTNWDQGNFLYGSSVNGSDFSALAANFGQGDSYPGGGGSPPSAVTAADWAALDAFASANGLSLPGVASVPEPATLSVIALAGAGLLARRRRR